MDSQKNDAQFLAAEAHLERAGRVEELLRLYESRARELPSGADAARLFSKAGELARDRLRNAERAEALFRRAHLADPSDRAPLLGLKSLYEQKQNAGALADTLERLATGADGAEATPLFLRAADLYEQKLGRKDRAVLALQRAVRADPRCREAWERIRRLLLSEGRILPAFESLERERTALGGGWLGPAYAEIAAAVADDPALHALGLRAVEVAFQLDPGNAEAKKAKFAIETVSADWRGRVRTLRHQSLDERDRKRAAKLSLSVARLHAAYDPNGKAKIQEALDRCFLLWPAMPEAIAFLAHQPDALVELERLAAQAREKAAQVELWSRVGEQRISRGGDVEAALAAYEKAAQADPGRSEPVMLAAELLLDLDRVAEAIALYERHLDALKDRSAQLALHLALADLCLRRLRNPEGAQRHLEAALKLDPSEAGAAFDLCQLLIDAEELEAAATWLDTAMVAPRPRTQRVALCETLSLLFEEKGDHRSAFEAVSRAIALDPGHAGLVEAAYEHAERAGAVELLAPALQRIAATADEPAATGLWRSVARLLGGVLARPDEADAAWREVLRRLPEDAEATSALEAPERGGPVAPAGGERVRLEAEAKALEAQASDPAALADVYRQLLQLDPDDERVLERLGAACAKLERWDEFAELTGRLVELASDSEIRRERQLRLARLQAEHLGRRDEAASLLLELLEDRVDDAVVQLLEKLGNAGVRTSAIARALESVYALSSDHPRHAAALQTQLSAANAPAEQKRLLRALAELNEKYLMDPRAAMAFWTRALGLDPLDGEVRGQVTRLARELGAQVELARELTGLASHMEDAAGAASLFAEAARLAGEGGNVDESIEALTAAWISNREDEAVFSQLVELMLGSRRLKQAAAVIEQRIAATGGAKRAELLVRLSQVQAEGGAVREAATALEEAIAAGAPEREHLDRLGELYEKSEQMDALDRVLARNIELRRAAGDDDRAARLSLRRAQVLEAALGDRAAAVKNYSDILRQNASDPDALAALEQLLEDPACAAEAARALAPAYEASNDHRKLVLALDRIAATAESQDEKIASLRKAAEVHLVHLRQPEMAFIALTQAVQASPQDAQLRAQTRTAAEDADMLDSYAEALEELADSLEGAAGTPLLKELAELYERKLDDRSQAVAKLRAVLELAPGELEALKSLQRLHRAGGEWAALAEVLEQLGQRSSDRAERASAWREAAQLHEQRLGDPESAVAAWRRIAEQDPLDGEAALAVDRLYSELDRPADLAFALELRRTQEGQSPLGREVAFRLAGLKRERLEDASGALTLFKQILDEDPGHLATREVLEAWARADAQGSAAALEILDVALTRSGDHLRRVALREARLAHALSEERSRLAEEIRRIQEQDLGQPELAFMSALKAFASNVDRERVQPDLERLAKVTGSFDELAEIYESTADELEPGDPSLVPLYRRAAELREQLGDNDEAVKLWQNVLEEAPQDRQALDSLGRVYESTQNARNLSEVYARQAQLSQDPTERRELLTKAGAAFESAGEDARAIESYKAVLALGPSTPALEALDRLYGRLKQSSEQADVLDQLSKQSSDEEQTRGYLLRRAQILEKETSFVEAVEVFSQVLALAPSDPGAVAGLERLLQVDAVRATVAPLLEPVYRSVNDTRKLAEVLDVRLQSAQAGVRLPLLNEIAVLREALGERSLAFAARMQAFAEDPEDAKIREELERLAADTGSFEELAGAYEDRVEQGCSDALALGLWRRLASLYSERLQRPELAARAFEQVAKRAPGDLNVLDALARIYRKTNAFRELADVMRRQVNAQPSVEEQVNLLFELGNLAEEQLQDRGIAAKCYFAILERKPSDLNAFKLLGRVLQQSERYPELAQLIGREIQLAESRNAHEEALELMVRLGRLRIVRLNDPRGGLETFKAVLNRKPSHAGAIGALEELARSDSALRGEAATLLEPVLTTGGDHLRLVQMMESRVSTEPVAQERAAMLRRMAEMYAGPLDSPEQAFITAARALRELPDDGAALDMCLSFARPADAEDALVELLEEIAPRANAPESRTALYRALAQVKEREGEPEEAVESWRRVLETNPQDAEALETMTRLLASQDRGGELLEVLRRQLSMAEEPERRADVLFQMGVLQADTLGDHANALATFRRLIEIRPDDARALERMDALCQQQERWPELADVLMKRLQSEGEGRSLELKFRLAQVREARLMDRIGALDLYTELLASVPTHPGALARVEAMVEREPQNASPAEVLLRAYRQANEVAKLAQLLESRAALTEAGSERKQFLLELAQLRLEQQDEPELAFMSLMRAFREDPNDAEVRHKLERAADASKTWDELAGVYEEDLPRIAEAKDAAEVCLKLGHLFDQRLSEPQRAVEYYERSRQLDLGSEDRALPALDRLYNQLSEPEKLVGVLESLSERATENVEKVGYLFRLGQIAQEALDSPDRAAQAYEKILELDPQHLASARLLEQLYEELGAADRLYRVLEHQRDRVTGAERERVLGRMARVSAESLSDAGRSIDIYRDLLEKNPRNDQAFTALEVLLEKTSRFEELRELLQTRLGHTIDPREIVRLNDRLGRVIWKLAGNAEEAIPYFKAALERDARHRSALEALRDIYEATERAEDLAVVLRRLVPLQEDAQGVKRVRIRLAEVMASMERREEALDAGRRALEVEPHEASDLERVQRLFAGLRAWGDAVRALELRAEVELAQNEPDRATATLFEVADLWSGPAQKPESAGAPLERILEIDPAHRAAYERARELYKRHHDWRAYAQVTDRFLSNLVTEEEKIATLRELAQLQELKLGHKDVAFLSECRALQLDPADPSIRESVERLAEETGSHEELAAVYEELADDLPRGPLAERLYLTLAKVHDEKLDDPAAAEAALRNILEFDPTNALALEQLAGMFARRGRNKEYVVALEQQLEATGSIEQRKQILREIARVFEEVLGDAQESANALLRALELEADAETLGILAQLFRRQKAWPRVAETLLRWRDLASTPEERARLQTEVAQVYEREINDDEAAIAGYRQALEFDPTNREALGSLERLYTKLDLPSDLLSVYERQLEVTHDYRERSKILFKSAAIWEDKYQNLANADACIEGVLSMDPQNLLAIKTLERLRRSQERWEELVGVLQHHINLVGGAEEQSELLVDMGDVLHQQMRQVDRAVSTYHRALELNPQSRQAMHALGTLYERSGNWPFALDMLAREAQVAGKTPEAVELYHRMGKINEDMLLDPASARACFESALRIDPGYLPCIRALKGIHQIEKDWDAYERVLVQEARSTEEPGAKAKALVEVAAFLSEQKEDRDGAAGYYEEALKYVRDLLEAARPLADIYVAREDWPGAERMLDIVAVQMASRAVAEQDEGLARELCRQLYRLGYVTEKLGRKEKALGAYEKAYQLDATYLPALEGLGNLLVQHGRFEESLKVYQTILIHHRDDLTDLEVVEIYWQLGDLHQQLGQPDRAENHFEKALSIDPGHEPSLRALVKISDAAEQWDKAAEYRQSLLRVLDEEPRFGMAVELAKLARDRLSDPYMAIDAFLAAHKLRPSALDVMDGLYVLYRETRQGQKAAEVLEKMLGEPELRASSKLKRVWYALGEICRDELKELDRAVMAFNAALDADHRFIEAFSALEQLLASQKQWKLLEDNYARMIQRLPKSQETHAARMTLWRALGDLYRQVLKNDEAAFMAYQAAAAGLPDDPQVQETFAELAQRRPGEELKAVDAWRRALPTTTDTAKVVNALATLQAQRKEYDRAWIAAQVAQGLIGQVGDAEREILAKLAPYAKKREQATQPLTDRLWKTHLFHPKVRTPLAELMAILFEQVGHQYASPHAQYQLNPRKHRIDVATSQVLQIHQYRYVAKLLGMEALELYSPYLVATLERMQRKSNDPAPEPLVGIEICHTHPVCLKVGGKFFPRDHSEVAQKELAYQLGRTMALLRPELAFSQRLPAERLEALVQAAVSLSVNRFRFTADPHAIEQERKVLEKTLTQQARMALAREVGAYVQTATPEGLRNYLEGAELTAVRTGLFVAGEVEPVKRAVMGETGNAYRVPARSKIRDLVVFALSDDLHALRVAVGTSVEVNVRR